MSTKFIEEDWLETWSCGECGVKMAVASAVMEGRRKSGKNFYCFNGHCRVFRKTTEDTLREELERERQKAAAADARANTADQERQQIAKAHKAMRRRVMNGVCPCCNRTFQNLMQHMKTEHPDFDSKKTLATMRAAFGMTQYAVAREIGVQQAYVSMYERDKPMPNYAKRAIDAWIEKHEGKLPA